MYLRQDNRFGRLFLHGTRKIGVEILLTGNNRLTLNRLDITGIKDLDCSQVELGYDLTQY